MTNLSWASKELRQQTRLLLMDGHALVHRAFHAIQQPLIVRANGEFVTKAHFERSDITFVTTCAVIGEAMVAAVLADAMLEKFGGDHIEETSHNWRAYMAGLGPHGE